MTNKTPDVSDEQHYADVADWRQNLWEHTVAALAEVQGARIAREKLAGPVLDAEHESYRSQELGVLLGDVARQLVAIEALVVVIHS